MSKCKKLQSKRAADNVWYRTISNPSCGVPVASATLRTSFTLNRHALLPACTCSGRARGHGRGLGRARCMRAHAGGGEACVVPSAHLLPGCALWERGGSWADACGSAPRGRGGVRPREVAGRCATRGLRHLALQGPPSVVCAWSDGTGGTQGRWQCCGSDGTTAGTRPASADAPARRCYESPVLTALSHVCAGLLVPRVLLHAADGHRPRLLRQPVPAVVAGWLRRHLHPPGPPPADLRLPRQLSCTLCSHYQEMQGFYCADVERTL